MGALRRPIGRAFGAVLLAGACVSGPATGPSPLDPAPREPARIAVHGSQVAHVGEEVVLRISAPAATCAGPELTVTGPCTARLASSEKLVAVTTGAGDCVLELRSEDSQCGVVRGRFAIEVLDVGRLVPHDAAACGPGTRLDAGGSRWCGETGMTHLHPASGPEVPIPETLTALLDDEHVLTCGPDSCAARDAAGVEVARVAVDAAGNTQRWSVVRGTPTRLRRAWKDAGPDPAWHVDELTWDGAHLERERTLTFPSPEPADMTATVFREFVYLRKRSEERPFGVVRALPDGSVVGTNDAEDGLVAVADLLVDVSVGVVVRASPLEPPLWTDRAAFTAGVGLPGVPLVALSSGSCSDEGSDSRLDLRDVSLPGMPLVAFACVDGNLSFTRLQVSPGGVGLESEHPSFLRLVR